MIKLDKLFGANKEKILTREIFMDNTALFPFLLLRFFYQAVSDFFSKRRIGFSLFNTTSSLITHSFTSGIDGNSYMISSMVFSRMALSPRAPDFLSTDSL